jgi:hypothetical protein
MEVWNLSHQMTQLLPTLCCSYPVCAFPCGEGEGEGYRIETSHKLISHFYPSPHSNTPLPHTTNRATRRASPIWRDNRLRTPIAQPQESLSIRIRRFALSCWNQSPQLCHSRYCRRRYRELVLACSLRETLTSVRRSFGHVQWSTASWMGWRNLCVTTVTLSGTVASIQVDAFVEAKILNWS